MLRFLQNNTIIIIDRKNSLTRQKGEVKDMKKKKVDKILKGVVTAGVALGGASYMTEADMVYAAELGEQGDETNIEKDLEEIVKEEDEIPVATEETPEVEESAEKNAPAEEDTSEGNANEEDASEGNANEEDAPEGNSNEEDVPEGNSNEEDAPEGNADEEGAPEEEVEDETPAEEDENGSEENNDDLPTAAPGARMLMRSAPPASLEEPPADVEPSASQKAYQNELANLIEDHDKIQGNKRNPSWEDLREYVKQYVITDLTAKGATNIEVSKWNNNSGTGNNHWTFTYIDKDGVLCTEHYGYNALDNDGKESKHIQMLSMSPVVDELKGKLTFGKNNGAGESQWTEVDFNNMDSGELAFDTSVIDEAASETIDEETLAFKQAIIDISEAQRAATKSVKWETWRPIIIAYAQADIMVKGGTVTQIGEWNKDRTVQEHYVELKYTDLEGKEQSRYFDYVALDADGNWDYNNVSGKAVIVEKQAKVVDGKVEVDSKNRVIFEAADENAPDKQSGCLKGTVIAEFSIFTNSLLRSTVEKLNEIREETKNAPTTGGNEDDGQGGNENNDGQGGNENNDGQGGNENNDGQGGNENNDGQGGNENNDDQGGNENDGTTPGTGGNEDDGTTPGTGGNEDDGTTPGTGGTEDGGTTPGTGGTEDGGTTPGAGGNEDGGTTPGTGGTEDGGTTPATGGNENNGGTTGGTADSPATEDTTPGSGAPDAAEPQTPPPAASSADNAGTTPAQETPAEDSVTTQTVNEQTNAAASQTQTVNTAAGNAEQTTETQTTQATQTSQSSVEIDNETVPLTVGASEDDTQDVVNIGETDVAKAAMIGIPEAPAAAGGLWSWILGVIAFISGKTAKDKKNEKGVFAEKDKDKK